MKSRKLGFLVSVIAQLWLNCWVIKRKNCGATVYMVLEKSFGNRIYFGAILNFFAVFSRAVNTTGANE